MEMNEACEQIRAHIASLKGSIENKKKQIDDTKKEVVSLGKEVKAKQRALDVLTGEKKVVVRKSKKKAGEAQ